MVGSSYRLWYKVFFTTTHSILATLGQYSTFQKTHQRKEQKRKNVFLWRRFSISGCDTKKYWGVIHTRRG